VKGSHRTWSTLLNTLMPPTRLSDFQSAHPSFLRHRFSKDSFSFPLKIDLSIPVALPAWASLPTPPMSGTPPPDPPTEPHQLAGRRRKREDTPTSTSQEVTRPASTAFNISPLVEQTALGYGRHPRPGPPPDQTNMLPPLPTRWEPPPSYEAGSSSAYALVTASLPPRPPPQISPRATRKVKAHVAAACINCKRKHLRCDETRPCRRCVQSGKEVCSTPSTHECLLTLLRKAVETSNTRSEADLPSRTRPSRQAVECCLSARHSPL